MHAPFVRRSAPKAPTRKLREVSVRHIGDGEREAPVNVISSCRFAEEPLKVIGPEFDFGVAIDSDAHRCGFEPVQYLPCQLRHGAAVAKRRALVYRFEERVELMRQLVHVIWPLDAGKDPKVDDCPEVAQVSKGQMGAIAGSQKANPGQAKRSPNGLKVSRAFRGVL